MAKVAKVAAKLSGAITSDMLSPEVLSKLDANQSAAPMGPITLSMLAPEVTAKLESNKSDGISGPITRDMLPADVLADLNNTAPAITSITRDMLPSDVLSDLNRTVTANEMAQNTITTAQLNEQILKYLKPEITIAPQAPGLVFHGQTVTLLSRAEGKFLNYQWHKNGQPIAGATGDRYVIRDINKTRHEGNYSLVVSNDFGSISAFWPVGYECLTMAVGHCQDNIRILEQSIRYRLAFMLGKIKPHFFHRFNRLVRCFSSGHGRHASRGNLNAFFFQLVDFDTQLFGKLLLHQKFRHWTSACVTGTDKQRHKTAHSFHRRISENSFS